MDTTLPPTDPATPVRTWTSDADYGARAARALVRQIPRTLPWYAWLLGAAALLVVATQVLADPSPLRLVPVVAAVAGLVLGWWLLRRRIARQIPAGTTFRAALTPDGLWLQGPLGTSSTSYAAFRQVVVRSGVVILVHRHGRRQSALSAALFPGSDLEVLRERIAAAQHAPGAAPPA